MNQCSQRKIQGFSLIELLLVSVIIGIMLVSAIGAIAQYTEEQRIKKTTQDMQQILNAALAYYSKNVPTSVGPGWTAPVSQPAAPNGGWPPAGRGAATAATTALTCLKGQTAANVIGCAVPALRYLPDSIQNNAWGQPYFTGVGYSSTIREDYEGATLFQVWTAIPPGSTSTSALNVASRIASVLPLGHVTGNTASFSATLQQPLPPLSGGSAGRNQCSATGWETRPCYVVAAVNVPPQSLNVAASASSNPYIVKFAGLYHHGGCVPVPTCPAGSIAQIFVVPTSVSGAHEGVNAPDNLYNISSFTAYARGGASAAAPPLGPPNCDGPAAPVVACNPQGDVAGMKYWRACLQVATQAGAMGYPYGAGGPNQWGQYVSVMAMTRCSPATGEPSGSNFQVYNQ